MVLDTLESAEKVVRLLTVHVEPTRDKAYWKPLLAIGRALLTAHRRK